VGTAVAQGDDASAESESGSESDEPSITPLSETLTGSAKADYTAGRVLFQDGDYAGALVKFESASNTSGDPRLLWNMAACHKALRHYAQVLVLLRRYETEAEKLLTQEDRDDVQRLVNAITPLVSQATINSVPEGATILIDGTERGVTPLASPLWLDIGTRKVVVRKEGYEDFQQTVSVTGGGQVTIDAKLKEKATTGTLIVHAGEGDAIRIDGKQVALTSWRGELSAGSHDVRVTGEEKQPYNSNVIVEVGKTRTLDISLETLEGGGVPAWVWITGGVLVASGAAVGGYFLFSGGEETQQTSLVVGTMNPGTVQLP
jgi:hypothetical protein